MQVSRIIKENLFIDSKTYSDLSPNMKDAVKDVFKFVEQGKGNVVEKFDEAIKTVASLHNLSIKQIEDYFDKEVIENLGEKTRDLGGLSFIGDGITNTIVKNNCVKNVIGFDTNPNGTILTPFFNWGIYLDNDASGFLVEGNVVNTNVNGGVFFHGGKDNMVRNNIFINCSNHFPKKGRYGYYDAGQSDVGTFLKHHSYNNSFLKNTPYYTIINRLWKRFLFILLLTFW